MGHMEHHTDTLLLTIISAIVIGVYLFVIANRLKIPAIVPLLFGGVIVGPEVLGWINPANIQDELNTLIKFAVAIILLSTPLQLLRRVEASSICLASSSTPKSALSIPSRISSSR